MSTRISRMYDSQERALQAARALRSVRHLQEHVYVAAPAAAGETEDQVAARIMKHYVERAAAQTYAKGVMQGGALVTVHAPFGSGVEAAEILEEYGPIDSGITEVRTPGYQWDEAAPVSSAFHLRVLSSNPTPFATWWNVPTLHGNPAPLSRWLHLAELIGTSRPITCSSSSTRLAETTFLASRGTVSSNPAPLSSFLHLPVLTENKTPTY